MSTFLNLVFLVCASFVGGGIPYHENKRLLLNIHDAVKIGEIDDRHLDEASGLCASRIHPGILYSHNDHGGHNRLYAIDSRNAEVIAVINVNGATNGDWEDIACGKCYGHLSDFCVYIGDIGEASHQQTIYRVVEPSILPEKLTVSVDGTLKYSWSEADSETLMVSPEAELYIISKNDDANSMIGLLPNQGWSQNTSVPITTTAHLTGLRTHHKDPVGGDISPDGQEILLKTHENVLHFSMNGATDYMRNIVEKEDRIFLVFRLYPSDDPISVNIAGKEAIARVLQLAPIEVPYKHERQGESVAFSADGRSYFTLGEGSHEPLYRYDASF